MVVIDAGHGGTDPGALANGIVEKNYALNISKIIKTRLDALGIDNVMTRTEDTTLSPSERIDKIAPYDKSGNLLVSNHLNAGGGDGAEVIYALRAKDNFPIKVINELIKEGQNSRGVYQRRLPSDTSKDYYYLMRDTKNLEPIIIEYGFLDSKGDDVTQIKNNYADYAEATVRAIANYLNVTYVPPSLEEAYVVKPGDTLYSISVQTGVPVDVLKSLNNKKTNELLVGEILKLPGFTLPEPDPIIKDYTIYTVQYGDSLYSIARKFNTTVDEIKDFNNLTTNNLNINQKLLIPTVGKETSRYIVKAGDSLYSIANKFNTTVESIKRENNLTSNNLTIGQVLSIPTISNDKVVEDYTIHTVVSGESLYSIAKKYGITVNEILAANNLSSNAILSIGQELKIPSRSNTFINYVVKSGESLYSIANKYGKTVNQLITLNNLTSNLLSVGQVLKIPN